MTHDRSAGILAHPTSFPGPHGIGDLGTRAHQFVEWLAAAEQRLWQVLPLGPTGMGNSPYASPSAFAGNPLLISLERLVEQGYLTEGRIAPAAPFPDHTVNFDAVIPFKRDALWDAFLAFRASSSDFDQPGFAHFCRDNAEWLDDYALFMAIKDSRNDQFWMEWPKELRFRDGPALERFLNENSDRFAYYRFEQFIFQQQWAEVKDHANRVGIQIVGDIPIYVAEDSADVWANPDQYRLDGERRPTVVTGVPPDYFSEDGQLWGNPMYDWLAMEQDGFAWWKRRIAATRSLVDIVRVDHFRGFAAGWVVPSGHETAREGWWEAGPGRTIFDALGLAPGDNQIVVEDLGLITADVHQLRDDLGFPGMKVLQFAFDGNSRGQYLPHMYERNCVVYPGTHDNQTTVGWFQHLPDHVRWQVQSYLGSDGSDIAWDFIRLALASVADTAIVPLQDVMRQGDEARMNTPGVAVGNWRWRYLEHELHDGLSAGMAELTRIFGRTVSPARTFEFDPFDYGAPNSEHPLVRRRDVGGM